METPPEPNLNTSMQAEPTFRVFGFRVGEMQLGIRVELVREVVALGSSGPASGLQLTQIPGVESPIRGVVMLRRQAVAIVDLAAFFDVRSDRPSDFRPRVLVVNHEGDAVGLLADEVLGIDAWPDGTDDRLDAIAPILRPYAQRARVEAGSATALLDVATLLETIAIR